MKRDGFLVASEGEGVFCGDDDVCAKACGDVDVCKGGVCWRWVKGAAGECDGVSLVFVFGEVEAVVHARGYLVLDACRDRVERWQGGFVFVDNVRKDVVFKVVVCGLEVSCFLECGVSKGVEIAALGECLVHGVARGECKALVDLVGDDAAV